MIEVAPGEVVLGVITGMTYGLLAIGVILIYRSSGVINFALGNIGGVAAAIMGRFSLSLGLPWLAVFPVALASGALAAVALEMLVMRRLRKAPRVMAIVATLGAAQLLLGLAVSITHIRNTALFPPPFDLSFRVGSLVITPYYVLILIMSPFILAALVLFLSPPEWLPRRLRSRYGPAMRAAADNPEAAATAGISAGAMSAMAWAIAGALASFSAILIAPARGFLTIDALGPDLLVRALAPAVIAGMTRLPMAFFAAIGIGVFEQIVFRNFDSGPVEGGLFVVILIGLLVRRRTDEPSSDPSWLALPVDRVLPDHLARVWTIRNLGRVSAVGMLMIGLLLPLVLSNENASIFVQIFTLATIGLSVTVITGITGQVSLGQFAIAGVGALVAFVVFQRMDTPWPASVVLGAAGGALASLVIGVPALRLRGLLLAVTSLAFAVMAPVTMFASSWGFSTGVDPGRPIIGSREVILVRAYYYIALAALVIGVWLVYNLKRGGLGRVLGAIRDSEDVARAFGIGATVRKLQGFMVSGLIAGLGGVVYSQSFARLNVATFPSELSVALLAMVVLGGISRVSGAVLGALYFVGLPLLVPVDTIQLLVSGVGLLVFVLYVPGGLAQILDPLRLGAIRRLARRAGVESEETPAGEGVSILRGKRDSQKIPERAERLAQREIPPSRSERASIPAAERAAPILIAEGLTVSYEQVRALDDLSLEVREGETLGIIGPNGSGKTTLFKALSGFVTPTSGKVLIQERDISHERPEIRARLGLVRSFQDSMLFPTLTVLDSVRLALESRQQTELISSVLGLPGAKRAETQKETRARELIELLRLGSFRHKLVGELSTGTRRITELCCMLALEPRLLLLDEPSSGIAQRETEVLGELLEAIKARTGATLVVIEHDMPLIMGISDRIVAMASGRKIAEGTPQQVQADEAVIDSYLGTGAVAVARSG